MDGEVAGATPPGSTGGGAGALTGLAFLLVPESQAYQAILGVLAAEPERSRTVGEIAAAVGADPAAVESRLAALVGWGDVSRTAEVRTVAEYREGAVRFGLSELGGRVWREVCRTSLAAPAEPVAEMADHARLLELARRFDESSDEEAVALYGEAIGLPAPVVGQGMHDTASSFDETFARACRELDVASSATTQGVVGGVAGRSHTSQTASFAADRTPPAAELRAACGDLARRRLSAPAFALLTGLVGRALARAVPGSDAYLADEASGLELQLLHSPGASTPLYGAEGTVTLDGFKLRLSVLSEDTGGE